MRVSLDGGQTWQDANDQVVVAYDPDEEGIDVTIHLTHEGVIVNIWEGGICVGTSSETVTEIAERLI